MTKEEAIQFATEVLNDLAIEDIGYCYNTAQEALDTLKQPAPDAWRPIETAPKDGTEVLLFKTFPSGEPQITMASYWDYPGIEHWQRGWRTEKCKEQLSISNPTHWQPLPQPPSGEGS